MAICLLVTEDPIQSSKFLVTFSPEPTYPDSSLKIRFLSAIPQAKPDLVRYIWRENMTVQLQPTPPVYAALLASHNRAADTAIVAGLPDMEPRWRPIALSVLIRRHDEQALAELVAGIPEYDDDLRSLLVDNAAQLHAGIRLCVGDTRLEVRKGAIELIGWSGDCRLAYVLAEALTEHCRQTAKLAAETLLVLAKRVRTLHTRPAALKGISRQSEIHNVVEALRRGIGSWQLHFRTEITAAAASLSEYLEDAILTNAAKPRTRIALAFNNVLAEGANPQLAGFVLRCLQSPEMRTQAAQVVANCHDKPFWEELLANTWLLKDEQIRKSCVRLRSLGCLQGDVGSLLAANTRRATQSVRLISASGLSRERKKDLLGQLLFSGNSGASRAAFWALMTDSSAESTALLYAAAARRALPFSKIARLELFRRGESPEEIPQPRHATGYDSASNWQSEPDAAFEPYWKEFDNLDDEHRVAIGHVVMETAPESADIISSKLKSADSDDRIKALMLCKEQGLAMLFEERIYELAGDPDATVRSAAVALLAQIDTAASQRILRTALEDPDPRTRANAIEALEILGAEENKAYLLPRIESETGRARANAIKALLKLRTREAAEGLLAMLNSPSPADRVSALWVVDQMSLVSVIERLIVIAQEDVDSRVRERAVRVLADMALPAGPPDEPDKDGRGEEQ